MARVVKESAVGTATRFSCQDFEHQCRALVARAREQAEASLAEARATAAHEAEHIRRTAQAEARAAGHAAGLEQIRAEATERVTDERRADLAAAIEALRVALAAYEQRKHSLLAQAERGVLELAVAIARRVCKHLPPLSLASAQENCRAALESVGRAGDLELHVAPVEYERLQEWAAEFTRHCDQLARVKLVADEGITPGGCRAHGRETAFDATIETQLDRVAESLLGDSTMDAAE